jgi:hypothetical protein
VRAATGVVNPEAETLTRLAVPIRAPAGRTGQAEKTKREPTPKESVRPAGGATHERRAMGTMLDAANQVNPQVAAALIGAVAVIVAAIIKQ